MTNCSRSERTFERELLIGSLQIVREKISNYLLGSSHTSKSSQLRLSLVQPLLSSHPVETLHTFVPQTCERIEILLDEAGTSLSTNYQGDPELTWWLVLFSKVVRARGDALLPYKASINSVFRRAIGIIHLQSYEQVADAAKHLLRSLTYVYLIEFRLTSEKIDESIGEPLPIRVRRREEEGQGEDRRV